MPDAAHPPSIPPVAGTRAPEVAQKLRDAVASALTGKPEVVERAVVAVLAKGHLLVEDIPGVGKTTLARALARAIGAEFRRVQCTSDMMPSDLLGVNVYDAAQRKFEFKPGPIFTNVLLADEINRTTPRTQSALLEAMSERQVSVDGVTRPLVEPFFVVATQNPDENAGTYPLPDSQLDRFLIRTRVGYPSAEIEKRLLLGRRDDMASHVQQAVSVETLVRAQREVDTVKIENSLLDYAHAIVTATRKHEGVSVGVSTRGAAAFVRAACARALVHGRTFVIPDDFSELAVPVLAHRLRLAGNDGATWVSGSGAREESERVVREILTRVEIPL